MDIILYAAIFLALVFFFTKMTRSKSKFGINLKRVYCPICGTKQPIIRMPQNANQFLYGGTTGPKCHTELDKYGEVISKKN
jgi:hypothetical protein